MSNSDLSAKKFHHYKMNEIYNNYIIAISNFDYTVRPHDLNITNCTANAIKFVTLNLVDKLN